MKTRIVNAWAMMLLAVVAVFLVVGPRAASGAIQSVLASDVTLVITGQGFGTAVKPIVTLGGTSLTVTAYQAGSITVTLPTQLNAGSYSLTLRTYSSATRYSTETFVVTLGAAGPVGPAGPAGQSVLAIPLTVGSAVCPTGGTEFQSASGYTSACNGTEGLPGSTGSVGPMGPPGTVGAQGVAGPMGPQGTQGVAGPVGPQGTQGSPGPQGPSGEQGHGAYWVDQSGKFVGVTSNLFPYVTWSDSQGILWGMNPEQVAIGMWQPTAGGIYKSGTIQYFETADCSGTAYVLGMPAMTSTYYLFSYWYRPATAQLRQFTPVAAKNWYTGQACSSVSPGPGFYLDGAALVPMRPQDDVLAELHAQDFTPPFHLVVR